MADTAEALAQQEQRLARRLARLFRFERTGRFRRWPNEVTGRLVGRRGELIDELMRLERRRRSFEPWNLGELDTAMGVLSREVEFGEQRCLERLAELGAELDRRRGIGAATGLRGDGGAGQLLGRG